MLSLAAWWCFLQSAVDVVLVASLAGTRRGSLRPAGEAAVAALASFHYLKWCSQLPPDAALQICVCLLVSYTARSF